MTISLTVRNPRTGAFGMVISSSSPAVAARCVHLAPGYGAAASQNVTNPVLGLRGLDLLRTGLAAQDVIEQLAASDQFADYRQLAVIDAEGRTAAFEGSATLGIHKVVHGHQAVTAGNLVANPDVPAAMMTAYESRTAATLEERLLDGLNAALTAGGEAGPVRSAGLAVVEAADWRVTDLRVDDHDDPLSELQRLVRLWLPQKGDYLTPLGGRSMQLSLVRLSESGWGIRCQTAPRRELSQVLASATLAPNRLVTDQSSPHRAGSLLSSADRARTADRAAVRPPLKQAPMVSGCLCTEHAPCASYQGRDMSIGELRSRFVPRH